MFETLTYLKNELGYTITEMEHGYRINGVVDIHKTKKLNLYVKPENKYHYDFPPNELIDFIKQTVEKYPDQPIFKNKPKTKHGPSYQEFRHMMDAQKENPASPNGADYYWNLYIDKKDDTHLYFIFHNGTVKIGKTLNIYNRIAQLKTGLSHEFDVVVFYNKGFLETFMHKAFIDLRKKGEWFKDSEIIKAFLRKYWSKEIGMCIKKASNVPKKKRKIAA